MRDLLIYLLDTEYAEHIRYLFSGESYKITIIENLEDVVEACQQELFDLAMVWPASVEKMVNFLTLMETSLFNYVPVIAVTPENEPLAPYYKLQLVELMKLPVEKVEFLNILDSVLADVETESTIVEGMNWQGSLEEYNLIDLIQMVETGGRDAELTITENDISASVFFHQGQLISARLDSLQGLDALKKLVFWPRGHFQTKLTELGTTKDEIGTSNADILMVLMESLVKQEQLYEGLPEPFDEILRNPLETVEEMTPLQHRISECCKRPLTVWELLMTLTDSNEDIMLELKIMMQMELIGYRSEVEKLVREHEEQSGIGKFFSSISSMFKKKDAVEEGYYFYDEMNGEYLTPKLEVNPLKLHRRELEKITKKLEELAE